MATAYIAVAILSDSFSLELIPYLSKSQPIFFSEGVSFLFFTKNRFFVKTIVGELGYRNYDQLKSTVLFLMCAMFGFSLSQKCCP